MPNKPHHEIYSFDGFTLDVTSAQLWYGETEIKLTPKERVILTHLVKNAGKLISYKELLSVGWSDEIRDSELQQLYESEKPQQQIERLNKKLRAHTNTAVITNIAKEGYRLEPDVRSTDDEPAIDPTRLKPEPSKPILPVSELTPDKTPEMSPKGSGQEKRPTEEDTPLVEPVVQSEPQGQEFNGEPKSTPPHASDVTSVRDANDSQSPSSEKLANSTSNEFSFLAYTAILVLAFVILGFVLELEPNRRIAYFEISLICGGIAYYLRRLYFYRRFDLEKNRPYRAVQQFQVFWTLLMFTWLGLYAVWFAKTKTHPLYVVATVLNNGNSLMLLLCYFVLNGPTISKRKNGEALYEDPWLHKKAIIGGVIILILGVAEKLALFKFPGKTDNSNILLLADLFSGTVGAISMGLFISRLHSRLLGESTLLPTVGVILYLYVAIQPLYFILNEPAEDLARSLPATWPMMIRLSPLIIGLAFVLKVIMFLYVTEIIRRNRLLFYMINSKRIYAEIEVEWRNFQPVIK